VISAPPRSFPSKGELVASAAGDMRPGVQQVTSPAAARALEVETVAAKHGPLHTRQVDPAHWDSDRAEVEHVVVFKYVQRLRRAMADLLDQLSPSLSDGPEAKLLRDVADRKVYNIVHLIYRTKKYEGISKDFEFSRTSMRGHWQAGYHDAARTLRHPEVVQRQANHEGVLTFDLHSDGRE
jgi:NTE family protein